MTTYVAQITTADGNPAADVELANVILSTTFEPALRGDVVEQFDDGLFLVELDDEAAYELEREGYICGCGDVGTIEIEMDS